MNDRLIVTFDNSQEDIPVLVVGHENISIFGSGPSFTVDNMITGNKAVEIWNNLKGNAKEIRVTIE